MKTHVVIASFLCVVVYPLHAGDKIDIPAVVTKAEAEKILGVPVKDPKGKNKEGKDGFYDSDWTYYAVTGDKALVFDVVYPGRDAPPHLTEKMFSVMIPDRGKPVSVEGLGDKANFCHDEAGLEMIHVLKGDVLISIGTHGVPEKTALEQEKLLAAKILARL